MRSVCKKRISELSMIVANISTLIMDYNNGKKWSKSGLYSTWSRYFLIILPFHLGFHLCFIIQCATKKELSITFTFIHVIILNFRFSIFIFPWRNGASKECFLFFNNGMMKFFTDKWSALNIHCSMVIKY